jgi:hypothetical protein
MDTNTVQGLATPIGMAAIIVLLGIALGFLLKWTTGLVKKFQDDVDKQLQASAAAVAEINKTHQVETKELRQQHFDAVKDLQRSFTDEIKLVRREQVDELKAMRTSQAAEVDRIWHHISKHEQTLPMTYVLRDDFIRMMSGFDKKLDQVLENQGALPCKNGGGCGPA